MTKPILSVGLRLASLIALLMGSLGPAPAAQAENTPPPKLVVIPGTFQQAAGCPGNWQPGCEKTALQYDAEGDVWKGAFDLPATKDEKVDPPARYKVALNGGWGENYGLHAKAGGADIPFPLPAPAKVHFYYDHKTHWVADSFTSVIAVAYGTFQTKLGCKKNNDPACLRGWLEDPDGTGIYALTTKALPAGDYEVKVGLNESAQENYGEDGVKDGPALKFTVKQDADEVYFGYDPATHKLFVSTEGAPKGSLVKAQAYWLARDTLVWPGLGSPKNKVLLSYDVGAGLQLGVKGITGGQTLPLRFAPAGPGSALLKKFPFLAGAATFKLDPADVAKVPEILKGQIALTAFDEAGKLLDATTPQLAGVLDDLFTYDGPLGVTFANGAPTVRVWAPTAQSVNLHLFADSQTTTEQVLPMTADPATGVWSLAGTPAWKNQFYLFEVTVYVRGTGQLEHNLVTDPYSFSLSTNSVRSQMVDLNDPALQPPGWEALTKPPLDAPEDIVLYELQVRDFSLHDASVPAAERGTFQAFTHLDSNGMKHLKALAAAGLTHVHLLPVFDLASIDEDKSTWQTVDEAQLRALPPDSDQQAAAVAAIRDRDGFNWGYDPYHYTTPEGSYSTNPDGSTRIREFRAMVQALSQVGLRVVMDVVYNHTSASGQDPKSVLDKVVPGYYHRLDANGSVFTSTCCQNTATENNMMRKLMRDSVVTWATAYKVDGFRFDLMGHHMLADMLNVRQALDALTPAHDGVDGAKVYMYGEGWNFGEVADNARGINATQLNIGGSGLGVFNDRLRDGARGGGPFNPPQEQGFVTGLFDDPNSLALGGAAAQKALLLQESDWIRATLAGNLKDFPLVSAHGVSVTAKDLDYRGAPAGYTLRPQENIVYVSAHDNETLFDAIQLKAPADASLADRVRMSNLGLSLVMFSQGVPFFHAGDELLRSKSGDPNSYNSGDWFNQLDFTYQTNGWGLGLPIEGKDRWALLKPLLADPSLKPGPAEIQASLANFEELLAIRKSTRLFRLRTADEVLHRLRFLNVGPDQQPGLIALTVDNSGAGRLDDPFDRVVVLFNASRNPQTLTAADFKGLALQLHPFQQKSADALVRQARFDPASGTFSVPGRTAAVFVVIAAPAAAPAPTATPAPTAAPTLTPAPSAATQAPAATAGQSATATALPTPAAAPVGGSANVVGWLAGGMLAALLGAYLFLRRGRGA